MRATIPGLAVLLGLALADPAHAQPCPPPFVPRAPDACGPGYYATDCFGQPYGPNYWLVPPYPPFNGMIFARVPYGTGGAGGAAGGFGGYGGFPPRPGYPSHPYARSPRDFFMIDY